MGGHCVLARDGNKGRGRGRGRRPRGGMQHRDGHVWGLQARLGVSVWDLGAKGASARWAVARVAGRGRTRKSALRYVCDCLVARGGARGECCGGEARPAKLLLPRRERGREDLRLSRSWCDRCQRRRASGVGVPGRGCEGLCRRWESAKVVVGGVVWCRVVW